ncbi:MAG: hypothetical protein CL666_14560 [Balneola sp.]|nr:hypothetical protein [Balneola sp.]|tara:strand:+ start:55670 stop:55876 length:207 start_codon:yes stop_codon:yes gene_type:complete
MSKRKYNNKEIWWLVVIFTLTFFIAGFVAGGVIGEQQGYESGLRDGVQSTLLINPGNECEIVKYNRGE